MSSKTHAAEQQPTALLKSTWSVAAFEMIDMQL